MTSISSKKKKVPVNEIILNLVKRLKIVNKELINNNLNNICRFKPQLALSAYLVHSAAS